MLQKYEWTVAGMIPSLNGKWTREFNVGDWIKRIGKSGPYNWIGKVSRVEHVNGDILCTRANWFGTDNQSSRYAALATKQEIEAELKRLCMIHTTDGDLIKDLNGYFGILDYKAPVVYDVDTDTFYWGKLALYKQGQLMFFLNHILINNRKSEKNSCYY